ncbi:MAG: peptidoglycan-binding protein [Acidobacteria bacterium]|nr:peptidoglycan-binding protein [Acidobacteriota bacterium]
MTDARGNTTSYTYDNMDRLATRTDPLLNSESYQYDLAGNLTQFTDRRSKVTKFTYDDKQRLGSVDFGWNGTSYESTIAYTYDAVDRLTQVVDSQSGTITLAYDNLDRLTSETASQGTVSYTYDVVGRRTSMTVAGQPVVNYSYDNADRLTQIAQGSSTVSFGYDNADRRTSLTLPNGIDVSYAYDDASQPTGMTYSLGANTLGNLTYAYDMVGRRTAVGGSFARSGLPQPVTSASYNANNQLTQWNGTTLTYDTEGNLTNDGTNTYTWDAGNHQARERGVEKASAAAKRDFVPNDDFEFVPSEEDVDWHERRILIDGHTIRVRVLPILFGELKPRGAALLRVPGANAIGHIVISDGSGGTIEAHSSRRGVIRNKVSGRRWDMGILVPGILYEENSEDVEIDPPETIVYRLTKPFMKGTKVREIQRELMDLGFHPGGLDGVYGPATQAAVVAFQIGRGLVPDREVGPLTARVLGIELPPPE